MRQEKTARKVLLEKARTYREAFERSSGRIQVSKTQLKKFKITAENCDMFNVLDLSAGKWVMTQDIEQYISELTNQGLIFKAVRFLK